MNIVEEQKKEQITTEVLIQIRITMIFKLIDSINHLLNAGEELISPVWFLGAGPARIRLNVYIVGDDVSIQYKTGNSEANCSADSWHNYVPFDILGYVRIRLYR